MSTIPEHESMPERACFSWTQLADTGVLWLVNRAVFHPRGFALALDYADGEDQPRGWSLTGSRDGEPFTFELPDGLEAERYRGVEELLAVARDLGRAPALDGQAA